MRTYLAETALLPQGWADDVLIEVEASGSIASVSVGDPPGDAERIAGIVIPGMIDLHSHAFQRALAGLTQRLGADEASFWTWRDTMYAFAQKITPDEQRAIAAQLQVELLKGGYTSVVEFHYLHHQPGGRAYDEPAAMSLAIHEAALETGIALTLLPVVYMQAGVDGSPLAGAQRRFALDPEGWARLADSMGRVFADDPNRCIGLALHSVRAVPAEAISSVLDAARSQPVQMPIHIHIAEQPKEVHDCLERFGRRPLQLLVEAAELDQRWCLVHGTHLTDAELALVAARQAVVGLCPTTEADLGDGIFPLAAFVALGGRYGIGSDSNMATDAAGELRLLEQGQRLAHLRRVVGGDRGITSLRKHLVVERAPGRRQGRRPAGGPSGAGLSCRPRGPRSRAPEPVRPQGRSIARFAPVLGQAVRCATSWSAAAGTCATAATPLRRPSHAPTGAHCARLLC